MRAVSGLDSRRFHQSDRNTFKTKNLSDLLRQKSVVWLCEELKQANFLKYRQTDPVENDPDQIETVNFKLTDVTGTGIFPVGRFKLESS